MPNPEIAPPPPAAEPAAPAAPINNVAPQDNVDDQAPIDNAAPPAPSDDQPAPEAPPTPEPEPSYVVELRQTVNDLKEQLETRLKEKPPEQPAAPAYQEPTPQDWLEIERGFGFSRGKDETSGQEFVNIEPRKTIEGMRRMVTAAMANLEKKFSEQLHGNVSDIRFNAVVEDMAGKHVDIRQHLPEIKEYLKRYEPQDRSNPKFIEDGLWWARGKKSKAAVAAANDSTRRNVRVVTPANNRGTGKAPGGGAALTEAERKMIQDGHFASEKELNDWKKADMSKI